LPELRHWNAEALRVVHVPQEAIYPPAGNNGICIRVLSLRNRYLHLTSWAEASLVFQTKLRSFGN
jgi:hypothetical protein